MNFPNCVIGSGYNLDTPHFPSLMGRSLISTLTVVMGGSLESVETQVLLCGVNTADCFEESEPRFRN